MRPFLNERSARDRGVRRAPIARADRWSLWIFKGSTTGPELSERAIQIDNAERKDRPFLAIWQADGGLVGGAIPPADRDLGRWQNPVR